MLKIIKNHTFSRFLKKFQRLKKYWAQSWTPVRTPPDPLRTPFYRRSQQRPPCPRNGCRVGYRPPQIPIFLNNRGQKRVIFDRFGPFGPVWGRFGVVLGRFWSISSRFLISDENRDFFSIFYIFFQFFNIF